MSKAPNPWQKTARAVTGRYSRHPDYEDLVAIAEFAAWESPRHSYIAALNAVRRYLRGPLNIHRTHTRLGNDLLVRLSLVDLIEIEEELTDLTELERLAQAARGWRNPEGEVIGRLWVEWCLGREELTQWERRLLSLLVLTGEPVGELSRRLGKGQSAASMVIRRAARKLKKVLTTGPERGYLMSEGEKTEILRLRAAGGSYKTIAHDTGRGRTTVIAFLKRSEHERSIPV